MKIELSSDEAAIVQFLVKRELDCLLKDEKVPKEELPVIAVQEKYHQLLLDISKKLK